MEETDERGLGRTRLIKIIRSAGTPCSINTSTAFIADPPVAINSIVLINHVTDRGTRLARRTKHRVQKEDISPSDV